MTLPANQGGDSRAALGLGNGNVIGRRMEDKLIDRELIVKQRPINQLLLTHCPWPASDSTLQLGSLSTVCPFLALPNPSIETFVKIFPPTPESTGDQHVSARAWDTHPAGH